MSKIFTPALRYHGGKFRLASWIISHFPDHRVYKETHGGAASVLLQKPRSHGEIYNDIDRDIFNLFQVLRDPALAIQLIEACQLTPYSRDEFISAYEHSDNPVERARRTIVRSQMGFGSGAATFHKTGFRCEASRKHSTSAHCWAKYPFVISAICERLQGVNIENRDAIDLINYCDTPDTLIYCDPPYLPSTRNSRNASSVYQHEMTEADHLHLIDNLKKSVGMVVLSGYENELYMDSLPDWRFERKDSRISAGSGTKLKTECLWINPAATDALSQQNKDKSCAA